ncbi:MAG: putative baseplate assembly protein [Candidatus Sulfotelmatobacter sp.]
MIFSCYNEKRKAAVIGNPTINGIDYLEVIDHAASSASLRQRTLLVTCLKTAPTGLTTSNVLIVGGESITGITAEWIAPAVPTPPEATPQEALYFAALPNKDNVLVVRTNEWGDFSPYTFRLVNDASTASQDNFDLTEALTGFDPQLAEVTFSFKVECGPQFDCATVPPDCPPDLPTPPPINYLAKDYSSFRQVMLDRLNQLLPSWNAISEADTGVMMAELISYAGDQLSYRQDAITTEAYLLTARSRISLRRHALLVDYRVHEGCNARVWIQVNVSAQAFLDRTLTRFYTSAPGMPTSLEVGANNEEAALIAGVLVFEPMQDANLFPELNTLYFYTWGDTNCCLPQGATEATLQGTLSNLQVGDVLIFQEVMGPQTGFAADADIRHRCAVRLTAVTTQNASGQTLVDPLFDIHGAAITSASQQPMAVTEIQWSTDDALPFPVCVSSTYSNNDTEIQLNNVSLVYGNIVLADQGLSLLSVPLGTMPGPTLRYPPNAGDRCQPSPQTPFPVRYRPKVPDSPITQAVPLPLAGSPATASAVPLISSGYVSLTDGNGFVSLMIAADAPLTWPQYFGILATADSTTGLFDLAVVFAPPGGPTGVTGPVVLEQFVGLSLTPTATNYAATQLASSQFISVPASFTPLGGVPAKFPTTPTMLPNSGTFSLLDNGGNAYLTLQPTNPLNWPPLFSVMTQVQLQTPDVFNLLLLYSPLSGAVGVNLPIIVEQINGVSLENAAAKFAAVSNLITVKTFEEAPNPGLSASDLMNFDADQAVPMMTLSGTVDAITTTWTAAPDLLADSPDDTQFVVEIDTDSTAYLRFGDNTNGKTPETGTVFTATYRIGNGTAGNVGADSLTNYAAGVLADSVINFCTNPLPASGGIDPETNAQIRRRAPQAFLTQERAVTMQDYVNVTEQSPQIEDAAATLRWTGSWYTVFITAEPQGNANLRKALRRSLTQSVNSYRLAGQDILIEPPQYVSLNLAFTICVDPDYFQRDVQQALLQTLGSGTLPNGQPALFAPQNFELGQTVYLSPIYAAARAVAGVQTVTATVFEPQGQNTNIFLQQGFIPMSAFQVARMDNDPSLPDHGRLQLTMKGGK